MRSGAPSGDSLAARRLLDAPDMNDRNEGAKTAATAAHSHTPAWWTDSLETSWGKVKAEAIHDWEKVIAGETKLMQRVDADAIAFGYGAHQAYRDFQVWGDSLETMLRADWKETGHDAECAWTSIKTAVRHGWDRAAGTTHPAVVKPADTRPADAVN
jgi:hypothetical protein